MRITFSLHATAWNGPRSRSHLGEPVVGRMGFLSLLEVHLGLSGPPVVGARRVAAYLVALRAADSEKRFYHRSLDADEMGTAAALLKWRDEWHLAGWDGKAGEAWPQRLVDMAAVEAATARVAPGEGERLGLIAERLSARRVPIEKVIILEPIEAFPARWQDVLQLLTFEVAGSLDAPANGNLGLLQTRCVEAAAVGTLAPIDSLVADDSVVVMRPLSSEIAEHWLAETCHAESAVSRMVVCDQEAAGAALDETLHGTGLPTCGFSESSTLRPTVQALPLALETLWDPIEPVRLLDFLMHPVGPLPTGARRRLGNAFAEQPGIGGPAWTKARQEIRDVDGADVDHQVTQWLEETRYDRADGAPLERVMSRVVGLRDALQDRLEASAANEDQSGKADLLMAVAQCSAVLDGLTELKTSASDKVKPRLLEQLIAQATADAGNSLAVAQVGCMASASSVAACAVERADEVVWWMPGKPILPNPLPWLQMELEALASAGVRLPDPANEMAAMMSLWIRPVLAARKRLVLVLPPEGEELHPAWQLLKVLAPQLEVGVLELNVAGKVAVRAKELLPASGVWKFDDKAAWRDKFPAPTRRDAQSYSSLDTAFNNPALGVLKDAAALRGAKTVSPGDEGRLLGTLAHRLVQILLENHVALGWDQRQLNDWFEPKLEELLRCEGMPLLAPGSAVQHAQFKSAARNGISALLGFLRAADVVKVEPERQLKGAKGDLRLLGDTDLLLHLKAGGTAALDLKWSRAGRFRDLLESGEFLQLALYAHMIQEEAGAAPKAVGYFTFLDGRLSTLTPGVFGANARVVVPKNGETPAQLVTMAKASWDWRIKQWREGVVEVIGDGLDPGPTEPAAGCLPLHSLGDWNTDYERLFGQREGEQ
jgi:hypothetical protein